MILMIALRCVIFMNVRRTLPLSEAGVPPVPLGQDGVRTQGRKGAVLEDGDAVRPLRRRAAVSDKNRRFALAGVKEPVEDLRLRMCIYGGEAVIQQKHGGLPDESPGEGRALALAPRQGQAPLPHPCVEAFG